MIGIISQTTNPAYNLATEELLLKHKSDDFLFLYTDDPCIIVGKHQNAYSEVNFKSVYQNNIPVYRRLSGGGTVYHDHGNLNFSFITSGKQGMLVDFEGFTNNVVKALNHLGVDAYYGGRHDLLIDGKKISGNASHVYKSRVMHHGTLLFNSDLSILGDSLKTDPSKYHDKAVKSVRSIVTNISDHLIKPVDFKYFTNYIFKEITKRELSDVKFSDEEIAIIENLIETKYNKWEWNFGYSPDYSLKKRIQIKSKQIQMEILFSVKKGIIQNVNLRSNKNENELISVFSKLIDEKHEFGSMRLKIGEELSSLLDTDVDSILIQLF